MVNLTLNEQFLNDLLSNLKSIEGHASCLMLSRLSLADSTIIGVTPGGGGGGGGVLSFFVDT